MENNNKKFYSIQELAELLPISRSALYAAVSEGEIPAKRIGRRILVPSSYLDDLAQI